MGMCLFLGKEQLLLLQKIKLDNHFVLRQTHKQRANAFLPFVILLVVVNTVIDAWLFFFFFLRRIKRGQGFWYKWCSWHALWMWNNVWPGDKNMYVPWVLILSIRLMFSLAVHYPNCFIVFIMYHIRCSLYTLLFLFFQTVYISEDLLCCSVFFSSSWCTVKVCACSSVDSLPWLDLWLPFSPAFCPCMSSVMLPATLSCYLFKDTQYLEQEK